MINRLTRALLTVVVGAALGASGAPVAFADDPTPPPSASPEPTASATTSAAPTAAASPEPSASPTPSASSSPTPMTPTLYTQPGDHFVNGRYWRTKCEMYSSSVVRCSTEIFGTKVITYKGKYYTHNGWSFNNLTYLPSPRTMWTGNPLAANGVEGGSLQWTAADGRQWKVECDTATTGRNACRAYTMSTVVGYTGGAFRVETKYVLNNIVMFSTSTLAHQQTPFPPAPPVPNMPVEKPFTPPASATDGFRTDSRCMTGRALCISKNQRKMAWMVNGQILKVVDVRFGVEGTSRQTRNGQFKVEWKSRDHVSGLYHTSMPFAMFFSGGQAVHYSPDFARNGYNGSSHGCVNVRDYNAIKWLFDTQVRTGDKVVVYY